MAASKLQPSIADQFRVLGTLGRGLRDFAREAGVDMDPIITAIGLDPADFENFEAVIGLDRFCRLLDVLSTIATDELFGLRFAESYRVGGAGPFGYGLMSAPTLREALAFCVKYGVVVVDLSHLSLEIDPREVRLEWGFSPVLSQSEQFSDFCAGLLMRHFRLCAGDDWRPLELRLARTTPRQPAEFRKRLCSNIKFESDVNVMMIAPDALRRENRRADRLLFELMTRQCAERSQRMIEAVDLVAKVRAEIMGGLSERQSVVASRLGMSERSLQRQLAERGRSFQQIVDETRRALSDRYLRDERMSIAEISHRLGFAAPSAYTRSALRWYGKPPSEARRDVGESLTLDRTRRRH